MRGKEGMREKESSIDLIWKQNKFNTFKYDMITYDTVTRLDYILYSMLGEKKLQVFTELLSQWTPVILGPSWWVGWAFFQLLQNKKVDVIWVWTRQVGAKIENKLVQGNQEKLYFLWDLFSKDRANNEAIAALLSSATANASWFHLYNAATNMDAMAELDGEGNVIDEWGNIIAPDDEDYKEQLDAINPQTMQRWKVVALSEKNKIRKAEADKQVQLFRDYLENILDNRNLENTKTLTIVYLWSIANMFCIAGSAYGDFKTECTELAEEYRIKFALKFGNGRINIIDLSLALVNTIMWNQRTHLLETTWKIVQFKGRWLPIRWEKINQKEMFQPDAIAQFFFDIMQEDHWELPSRMLIHSPESIDIEKQKRQYQEDMTYILQQYVGKGLDKDDKGEVMLNEKAREFLLNLRQYKLDEYYNNYYNLYPFELTKEEQSIFETYWLMAGESIERIPEMLDDEWEIISIYNDKVKRLGRPSEASLAKNIRKWQKLFTDLSWTYTTLPKDIFLNQAMRFLNNHI
jgi:hypothetical protein